MDSYPYKSYEQEEMEMDKERKKHHTFRLGDTVRIMSGPFVSFTGKIEGINQSKALLLVKVAIYGRSKPIRLNFADVEVMSAS
jgi:transcription termination/antitermination protein NusG